MIVPLASINAMEVTKQFFGVCRNITHQTEDLLVVSYRDATTGNQGGVVYTVEGAREWQMDIEDSRARIKKLDY